MRWLRSVWLWIPGTIAAGVWLGSWVHDVPLGIAVCGLVAAPLWALLFLGRSG